MTEPERHDRYPGARPFMDTDTDRSLFFGRDREINDLFYQVLGTDLLVLFGKSGLGKTSLLQAGIFPRLRERELLPLPVRLNRTELPPLELFTTAIAEACQAAGIDYTPGETGSLWEFFKTAVFWRGETLQTPVLVLDQFEEIFTLQDAANRQWIARELGELVSGGLPQSLRVRLQAGEKLPYSEKPPAVKVILSLREDYLGALQELAAEIPRILENRFRLTALSREQARPAVVEPAKLPQEELFVTRSFRYEDDAVEEMLAFLGGKTGEIEPFQLQVLCSQVEQRVTQEQARGQEDIRVDKAYLGGRARMEAVLQNFYLDAIKRLPSRRIRNRARELCEEGLLDSEGHRRILEEKDIKHRYINYRPSLVIYLVWHPQFAAGERFARRIYSRLTRNVEEPLSRGLGIPVLFRSVAASPATKLPCPINLDEAEHTVVIALIDDQMVIASGWDDYLVTVQAQISGPESPHRLLPVALSKSAVNIHPAIAQNQFIRLLESDETLQTEHLLIQIIHELCRLLLNRPRPTSSPHTLSPAPVTLFISHAKQDGADLAKKFHNFIQTESGLDTFFDTSDISPGSSFAQEIKGHIGSTATLVVLQTDAYASREWCRLEVIEAKRAHCPVIVVNQIERGEERSFPYLGNVPTIRCASLDEAGLRSILKLALYETLKHVYLRQHLKSFCRALAIPDDDPLVIPPEPLTLLDLRPRLAGTARPAPVIVYPDPPLGDIELSLLSEFEPHATFVTPTLFFGLQV